MLNWLCYSWRGLSWCIKWNSAGKQRFFFCFLIQSRDLLTDEYLSACSSEVLLFYICIQPASRNFLNVLIKFGPCFARQPSTWSLLLKMCLREKKFSIFNTSWQVNRWKIVFLYKMNTKNLGRDCFLYRIFLQKDKQSYGNKTQTFLWRYGKYWYKIIVKIDEELRSVKWCRVFKSRPWSTIMF